MEWSATKEQVFAFGSDIVVSAGAGSGKTAALVELYLRLLAGETRFPRPLSVEEIVAITFTDKAALEMMERIRSGMARRLACGDDPGFWTGALRGLSSAPISTFHAFCARLLRDNPAEAGVDPAFSLLDEPGAWGEIRGALGEVIERELRGRTPAIRLLLEQYPLSGAGRGKGLADHLLGLRREIVTGGREPSELAGLAEKWADQARAIFRDLPGRLDTLLDRIRLMLREREGKSGKEPAFVGKMRALLELADACRLTAENGDTPALLEEMLACLKGSWGDGGAPLRDEARDILESVRSSWHQLNGAPVAMALLELTADLEAAYRLRKQRRGALDFDDLLLRARHLLANDESVRDDCRRRFPVIMVDEFQDTNPVQKELVDLLRGEGQRLFVVGDPKQSIYLFRGADVTLFGRARDEMLRRRGELLFFQESFRSREGIISFVNSLFSDVMGKGGGHPEQESAVPFDIGYGEGDHLQPRRRDWDGTSCVELITVAAGESSGERRRAEAKAVAARILRMVTGEDGVTVYDRKTGDRGPGTGDNPDPVFVPRKPRFGDVAVLFRRFTHLKIFEQELRRCAVPYYVVKGKGFYQCQEVLDLLNFLRYLEFRGNLVSLAGLLRSPLCGVSDETLYLLSRLDGGVGAWDNHFHESRVPSPESRILDRIDSFDREKLRSLACLVARLRPLRDRLTLAELMEEILKGTDFMPSLHATFQGEQKGANLRKLIEFSRSFSGPGEGGLRGFVAYLDDLVRTEPTEAEALISAEGEDVVRLMTVHQSKGLEFPVVFIPELGAGSPPDSSPVQFEQELGIGLKSPGPDGGWHHSLASRAITDRKRRQEEAERKRLFYVAVTRARDYLVLSGERGGNAGGSWREWIDGFIGEGTPLLRVTEGDSRGCREESAACGPFAPGEEGRGNPAAFSAAAIGEGVRRSLLFSPPLPSAMIFSPTALEDYDTCPRKYYYKAVAGLDEGLFAELLASRRGAGKRPGRGMTPLDKGNLAHLVLERTDFTSSPETVRSACLRAAAETASPAFTDSRGGREVADNLVSFVTSPLGRQLAGRQLAREWPFMLKLRGQADYFIRGAMDLVALEEGKATVYDYKYLERGGTDLEGYRFQLTTYMLVLQRLWPERRIEGNLVFLKGGGTEAVTADLSRFEHRLLRIMDAIRERSCEGDFGLKEGCDGRHCPFGERCRGPVPHRRV